MEKLLLAAVLSLTCATAAQAQVQPPMPEQLVSGKYCKIIVGSNLVLAFISKSETPGKVEFASAFVTGDINMEGNTPEDAHVTKRGSVLLVRTGDNWTMTTPAKSEYILNFNTYSGTSNGYPLKFSCTVQSPAGQAAR